MFSTTCSTRATWISFESITARCVGGARGGRGRGGGEEGGRFLYFVPLFFILHQLAHVQRSKFSSSTASVTFKEVDNSATWLAQQSRSHRACVVPRAFLSPLVVVMV